MKGLVGLLAVLVLSNPALAQETPPNQSTGIKTLKDMLADESPTCIPMSTVRSISDVVQLTPEQFQFIRALYIAVPPVSKHLPPGSAAYLAHDKEGMTIAGLFDLENGDSAQTCARFNVPPFMLDMLDQVGRGVNGDMPGEKL